MYILLLVAPSLERVLLTVMIFLPAYLPGGGCDIRGPGALEEDLRAAGFTGLWARGTQSWGQALPSSARGWPRLGRLGTGACCGKRASWGGPGSSPAPSPLLPSLPAQPMNATSAFGPNLRYIVKWRRRETREAWNNVTVWGSRYVVGQTPVYVPYEIRVQAENDFGKGPEPDTVIGYSGEDCEYPTSFHPQPTRLGCPGHPCRPGTLVWALGLLRAPWRTANYQERGVSCSDLEQTGPRRWREQRRYHLNAA